MDAVAMACSLYRRGVPFIKVPTTLLGIVDASIGIKTSVNHFGRRNRLGSYFFPKSVLVDPSHLCTLDENQISYGLAEVIKLAIIKDKSLFESMKEHSSYLLDAEFYRSGFGLEIIKQAMAGMIKELAPNPYETDLQRVVDFGHTFSPVPEMKSLVDSSVASLAHGQAVALDCLLTCAISHKRNLFKLDELVEVVNLMDSSGLASRHPYFNDVFMLWESLNDAVRHRDGSQNIPLPTTIGDSFFCNDLSIEELTAAVEFLDCWLRESGR